MFTRAEKIDIHWKLNFFFNRTNTRDIKLKHFNLNFSVRRGKRKNSVENALHDCWAQIKN